MIQIPISTKEHPESQFQTFIDISLPEKTILKSRRPKKKMCIRGASSCILNKLCDKIQLGLNVLKWNIDLGDDHLILRGGWHFLVRTDYFRVNRGQNIYFQPQQIYEKAKKKKKGG